jgi:hypothetical protein
VKHDDVCYFVHPEISFPKLTGLGLQIKACMAEDIKFAYATLEYDMCDYFGADEGDSSLDF